MSKRPVIWLRCECRLLVRSQQEIIAPRAHPTFNAKSMCRGVDFTILHAEPAEEERRRADSELDRRVKKHALLKPPKKRAYKLGPGTSPWDGVRSTTARPSKGSAGAPTLGKRH